MKQVINTWDQQVAALGDRIAIFYSSGSKWRCASWKVYRIRNGKQLATDATADWEDGKSKTFDVRGRIDKKEKLQEAIAWAIATYGPREFVRNRMGDYVEKEVNDKYPLPRDV